MMQEISMKGMHLIYSLIWERVCNFIWRHERLPL